MGVHWPGRPVSYNPVIGCGGDGLACETRCWARAHCRRGMHPDHRKVAKWDGTTILRGDKVLYAPIARRKPTLFAVTFLGDLFHRNVPDEWIDRVFAVMAMRPQHTFLLLTKRADRMLRWAITRGWPLPNVWSGVTVSTQADADEQIPLLQNTPAAHRLLSLEPTLEPIDLTASGAQGIGECWLDYIQAVIAGCEAGPQRRPCPDKWLDDVAEQCRVANVPYWTKQRNVNGKVVPQPLPQDWPWIPKEI